MTRKTRKCKEKKCNGNCFRAYIRDNDITRKWVAIGYYCVQCSHFSE